MSQIVIDAPWLFQTWQGDLNLTDVNGRSGTLTPFPPNGNLMIFDTSVRGGFSPITPAQLVTLGTAAGGSITASSISLLTAPGQLLTSTGTANYVLPPGTDGYTLRANSGSTGGLEWVPPTAVSGVVTPTAGTIVQRDSPTATIFGQGFVSNGNYMPSATNTYNLGSSGVTMATVYSTNVVATLVTVPTVTGTSGLALTTGSGSVTLAPAGSTVLTATAASVTSAVPLCGTTLVVGGYQQNGSWQLSISGSTLLVQYWNGSAYTGGTILASS